MEQQQYSIDYDYDIQTTGNQQTLRDFSARSDISIDSIERNGGVGDVTITSATGQEHGVQNQSSWLEGLAARGARIVQVTYPRTANNDKELTVARGEYLEILDDTRKWWKARNIRGQMAHVPNTIVTPFNFTGSSGLNNSNIASGSTVPEINGGNESVPSKKGIRPSNVGIY